MAFYYVKSGGTATGDGGRYASAQTGAFSGLGGVSNYYDNVKAAMDATTTPASSDQIRTSDAHSHSYTANNTYNGPTSGAFLEVISVSDTAIDAYSIGAAELSTDGFDLTFVGRMSFAGFDLLSGDDVSITSANAQLIIKDGALGVNGTNDIFRIAGDGVSVVFINSDLKCMGVSASVSISNAAYLEMYGGAVLTGDRFLFGQFHSGGATIILCGTDLSQVDSALLRGVGGGSTIDDLIDIRVTGCIMSASSPGFADETFTNLNHKLSAFNSTDVSAEAEYQFFVRTMGGDAEDWDDAGIHRDESTAFPGGKKVSIKTTGTASVSVTNPLVVDLPARFAALSSASTDTIKIYFASTTTLTDTNVWAELVYPDGTNKQTYTYLSNQNADILAAGTPHDDDSGSSTWKDGGSDLVGYNEYSMILDTSGDAGADSVPIIRIYIAEPSITVYFDTTVDVVA